MPNHNIFLDSSVLLAGIISDRGASRALLLLGEASKINLIISEQVVAEVERNLARKVPKAVPYARNIILSANIRIVRDPSPQSVQEHLDWTSHKADVPILVVASQAAIDYLATLNTKHFLANSEVARRSGLRIGAPGEVLAWVREQLKQAAE